MYRNRKFLYLIVVLLGLAGCTVNPVPMDSAERERLAAESREKLFANQVPLTASVSLPEATARAVKYYADYRIRIMEEAAAAAQLDVSKFDMLPRLTTSAGYTTRNNDSFGFGFSPNGTVATNPSASSERDHNTLSVGFAWNVLDFGVSYFKAKQSADQTLIARQRRVKAIQVLVQDVRRAWWRAEAAQRLLPVIDDLLEEIEAGLERTRIIESRKLLPPSQIVSLRRTMLELEQQMSFRRQELAQARVELAALINVPPGTDVVLERVAPETRRLLDLKADADRLESTALRNRPELAEEGYKARITESEVKKGILGVMPNLNFDLGLNYDSNRFLVNNVWSSAGLSMAFNLIKVFSIPARNRSAEAQRETDEARRLAMAMAILTQTRIATVRYTLIAHEYGVWDEAARDDDQLVKLLISSAQVGIDTELELLRARARAMISAINRDLSYANLENAVGQIYQSAGFDAVSDGQEKQNVTDLTKTLGTRLTELQREVFSDRTSPAQVSVALGEITGVDAKSGALLVEGLKRIFESSRVRLSPASDVANSDFRIGLRASLQPPKSSSQSVQLNIQVADGTTQKERFTVDFRTTLSDPVDDEQIRVLGEGAAFRVLGWLAGAHALRQGARTPRAAIAPAVEIAVVPPSPPSQLSPPAPTVNPVVSQAASTLPLPPPLPPQTDRDRLLPNFDGEPLALRIDLELRSTPSLSLSRLGAAESPLDPAVTAVIQ